MLDAGSPGSALRTARPARIGLKSRNVSGPILKRSNRHRFSRHRSGAGSVRPATTKRGRSGVISNHVDPEYFSLFEIPMISGRTFAPGDDPSTAIVISRTLANRMYGTTDVVGMAFPKSEPTDTIIGVAGDAHTIKVGRMGVAELYRPLSPADYSQAVLIARARTDAARLRPVLSEAATLDARVLPGVRLLRDDFQRQTRAPRLASGVVVSIGVLTLLLACIGIFGVVSYGVALRTEGNRHSAGSRRRRTIGLAAGDATGVVAGVGRNGPGCLRIGSGRHRALEQPDAAGVGGPRCLRGGHSDLCVSGNHRSHSACSAGASSGPGSRVEARMSERHW